MLSTVKVIFLDARDTLGEVDRPGHFMPYRPSTEKLLEALKGLCVRIGVITNLPPEIGSDEGKDMMMNAVLTEDGSGKTITIGDYIDRSAIITNKEAGADKPSRLIYEFAAKRLNVVPSECLFIGENLIEGLGAEIAGMRHQLKPCPPGREFLPALAGPVGETPTDSGRQFEAMLEQEHLLSERMFACGTEIAKQLSALTQGSEPPLDQEQWMNPGLKELPEFMFRAIAHFMHLVNHFVGPVHFRAEEALFEVAITAGLPRKEIQWIFNQHDQSRAYSACLNVAWRRIQSEDADDRFSALIDFQKTIEAFLYLFKVHSFREEDQAYALAGSHFSDADDSHVLRLVQNSGGSDIMPYVAMVMRMERILGLSPP